MNSQYITPRPGLVNVNFSEGVELQCQNGRIFWMLKFVQRHPLATIIVIFLSIVINVFGIWYFVSHEGAIEHDLEESSQNFPYLSQRIFAEDPRDFLTNFEPLRNALQVYITEKGVRNIGVFFEYLPSGTSIGVNDRIEHQIASLVKVPVVIGTYKQIEEGKLTKETLLTIAEEDIDKRFGNLWQKGAGAQISVKEAIDLTLKESDNTSANLLLRTIGDQELTRVFTNLEIEYNKDKGLTLISPKNYSSVFRTLYLSSYLSFENSSEILDILTLTIFKDYLEAGVDSETKVAHKIGVYTDEGGDGLYSDCGNIYLSNRPYFLCIMVVGNEAYAKEQISEISKMVSTFVANATISK